MSRSTTLVSTKAKAREEAIDRFVHDYDLFLRDRGDCYWQCSSTTMDSGDGHQFILRLELEDADEG